MPRTLKTPLERFEEKVAIAGELDCWLWTAGLDECGYGRFKARAKLAHRWIWEHIHGQLEVGYELDHLCRNRACVNLRHLEPVTHAENVHRGESAEATRQRQAAITHCPRGHEYTPDNIYWLRGARTCRHCRLDDDIARRTHCPQGHPYDESNVKRDRLGRRRCIACGPPRWRSRRLSSE
jgi:hypothetical protein